MIQKKLDEYKILSVNDSQKCCELNKNYLAIKEDRKILQNEIKNKIIQYNKIITDENEFLKN